MSDVDCRATVREVVSELRKREKEHSEKATSVFSSTVRNMASSEAYRDAADLLEQRVCGESGR